MTNVSLAAYIDGYIATELERNPLVCVDRHMVATATEAYEGGAGDMEDEPNPTGLTPTATATITIPEATAVMLLDALVRLEHATNGIRDLRALTRNPPPPVSLIGSQHYLAMVELSNLLDSQYYAKHFATKAFERSIAEHETGN